MADDDDAELRALIAAGIITEEDLQPRSKKRPKKGSRASRLSGAEGWRFVDVNSDSLLLGAAEGGFGGLEVLDDPTIIEGFDGLQSGWQRWGRGAGCRGG